MENGPFENAFPIQHGNIPASYVSLPEGRGEVGSKLLIFVELSH